MKPSILVVGATGNTGSGAVFKLEEILSKESSPKFRVLAITRDKNSETSKTLDSLPHVDVEQVSHWPSITSEWLRERRVERVYLAAYNSPSQFADESAFILSCRNAGVQHLVKLSTMPHFIGPHSPIYYGRIHWAIEKLLNEESEKPLNFTVLRANYFSTFLLNPTIEIVKKNHPKAPMIFSENAQIAIVHPHDVGAAAATILTLDDEELKNHNGKTYNISGPRNETGSSILGYLQKYYYEALQPDYASKQLQEDVIKTMKMEGYVKETMICGFEYIWKELASLQNCPTSPELLTLAPATRTTEEYIKEQYKEIPPL